MTDPTATFSLTLPNNWFELDLKPSSRDLTVGLLAESRVRDRHDVDLSWP